MLSLTVARALEMEIFNQCRLRTGKAGLQNKILCVNILEILDDLSHIEPGEFLITTAHDFNSQSESKQQEMVELFAARKLAALAIQTGYYLEKIPASFIRFSEEHGIPLIEIPPEVSFKNLIRALMKNLLPLDQGEDDARLDRDEMITLKTELAERKKLWKMLIENVNPESLGKELQNYGIDWRKKSIILALSVNRLMSNEEDQAHFSGNRLYDQVEIFTATILQRHNLHFLIDFEEGSINLLLQSKDLISNHPDAGLTLSRQILVELRDRMARSNIRAGCSPCNNINMFNQSLHEALKALQAARLGLFKQCGPVASEQLGLYSIIMEVKNQELLGRLFSATAAPLHDYDRRSRGALMETLRQFLKSESIKIAAEALFIHRHTMRYRLEQIAKLTGFNPLIPEEALQLNLGLHIFNYLQASGLLD